MENNQHTEYEKVKTSLFNIRLVVYILIIFAVVVGFSQLLDAGKNIQEKLFPEEKQNTSDTTDATPKTPKSNIGDLSIENEKKIVKPTTCVLEHLVRLDDNIIISVKVILDNKYSSIYSLLLVDAISTKVDNLFPEKNFVINPTKVKTSIQTDYKQYLLEANIKVEFKRTVDIVQRPDINLSNVITGIALGNFTLRELEGNGFVFGCPILEYRLAGVDQQMVMQQLLENIFNEI